MKELFVGLLVLFSPMRTALAAPDDVPGAVQVSRLSCEYLESPQGIDEERPRLSWRLASAQRGQKQTAWHLLVASSREKLDRNVGDLWDSGKVESDRSMNVEYAGAPLESGRRYFWKVMVWGANGKASEWSEPGSWGMGMLRPDDWSGSWIQSDLELYDYQKELRKMPDYEMEHTREGWKRAPKIRKMTADIDTAPAVWLRREFTTNKKSLRRAVACISGLGFYELLVNGRKVNDHVLSSSPYEYDKAVPYEVLDVTGMVGQGKNAVGVILGNGYYNPVIPSLLREYVADYIDTPRLLFDLILEYEDGSVERVVSDRSWKFTTDGPIRFNSLRAGETYDARKELGDWASPGYEADGWMPALAAEAPAGKLDNQDLPPVRVIEEIPAVSVVRHEDGYRFDIGVEATGWARLTVRGRPGQEIIIRYPGTDSHTFGRYQECRYICKGGGAETYEPRFAFNGYQFIDVIGLDYEPKPADLVGLTVVSDLQNRGRFACSSPELTKLQPVIRRTLRNYNIQMPMDPVREKACWTQDVETNFETTAYNYDVYRIYQKWQEDFIRSVYPNGYVPPVVPSRFGGPTINGPWWGGMIAVNPWQLYQFYGDRRVLERSYEPMKRQLAYLDSIAVDGIVEWGLGDWLDNDKGKQSAAPQNTTVPFTSTCGYLMMTDIARKTAILLEKPQDAARLAAKAGEIRKAIHRRFYDAEKGQYDKGSQTACVLALLLDLPAPADRDRVVANLRTRIAEDGCHVSSGFIGIPLLLSGLTENGLAEEAWRIATNPDYPGWFDMVFTQNNSVLKEHWKGSVQMPSLAAPIGAWCYRSLGGIRPDPATEGFKSFIIQPYTDQLEWVECEHECPYGLIRNHWRRSGDVLTMDVSVPVNTTATIHVPGANITEGGRPATKAPGVTSVREENGLSVFRIESGEYRFTSRSPGNIEK